MSQSVNLIVAGFDPSGGAGILLDSRVHQFFKVPFCGVITANTIQNSCKAFGWKPVEEEIFKEQLFRLEEDYKISHIKVGMLGKVQFLEHILDVFPDKVVVLDPVIKSSSGYPLIDEPKGVLEVAEKIFLVTPNLLEAQILSGLKTENPIKLLEALKKYGFRNVLLKGGHYEGENVTDYLLTEDGSLFTFKGKRFNKTPRGTGCALSSAIVCNLHLGKPLVEAVESAINFVREAIKNSQRLGRCNEILLF
jgi:hydroxymethylpyrimidine/phosphomethylpyrimidine kinase